MKNLILVKNCSLIIASAILFLTSCSSSPKRPAEIVTTRNSTVRQLDLANVETEHGNYMLAKTLMDEAWRMAVSIDSSELRILTQLSMGNLFFYQKNQELAQKYWKQALDESIQGENEELVSLSKIYECRGLLSYGSADTLKERSAEAVKILEDEMGNLKKTDELYIAYAYLLLGFAQKGQFDWNKALQNFESAAKIHEKLFYLESAAYDWYAVASVYSVSGDTENAVSSIQKALSFDRRAENSYGLGMDYLALGDIYTRASRLDEAKIAYQRSVDILNAASLDDYAKEVQEKLGR